MNNKTPITSKQSCYRFNYKDPMATHLMSKKIISLLPKTPQDYVIVFIGTDRSTGDALGPIAGTLLQKERPKHMTLYGTLHYPVHAQNLQEYIDDIYKQHRLPYIIAVDACLGRSHAIGQLITGVGSLKPGAALNKDLPAVGDLYVTGVVNLSGYMEHAILQNTRLSVVSDMAHKISSTLYAVDQYLARMKNHKPIMLNEKASLLNEA